MAKILISSLGKNTYNTTCYKLKEVLLENCLLPSELLIGHISFDRVYLVGTEKSNWACADERLGKENYIPIKVPFSESEDDWWRMLQKLTHIQIRKDDDIYMDMTHSLRALSFFSLLSLFYFEKVYDANIRGVYYGAFEMSYPWLIDGREVTVTPIIELTPYLELMDWIEGFAIFKNYGDAGLISKLIDKNNNSEVMREFCERLNLISNAFGLNYTKQIADSADYFLKNEKLISDLMIAESKPADIIKEELLSALKRFSPARYEKITELHLDLIEWYLDHKRYVQGMLLMRELVTTFFIEHIAALKIYNDKYRSKVTQWLTRNLCRLDYLSITHEDGKLLKKLINFRNVTAHGELKNSHRNELLIDPRIIKEVYFKKLESLFKNKKIQNSICTHQLKLLNYIGG